MAAADSADAEGWHHDGLSSGSTSREGRAYHPGLTIAPMLVVGAGLRIAALFAGTFCQR